MASISNYVRISLLISILVWVSHACEYKVFNVKDYGAIDQDTIDSTQAFLRAWHEACQWQGYKSIVMIPEGTFRVGRMIFSGECNPSKVIFNVRGTLKPSNIPENSPNWINFRHINGLAVKGCGALNAEGDKVWGIKDPNNLPITLKLDFLNDTRISGITSQDSQQVHFSLYECKNMVIKNIKVSSPSTSPNTDGIKMSHSNNVKISDLRIETGDDCISILRASQDIEISNVHCGPGHGISVGSLGKESEQEDEFVRGVSVKRCNLKDTRYGLRIKSFRSSVYGSVSNITYEDIHMDNVRYPIIIDQQYCTRALCYSQTTPSHIQIEDVTYNNIWGTSSSKVAVRLKCSQMFPCKNIVLNNINLSNRELDGFTSSSCINAFGNSYGEQRPPSCF